MKQIISVADMAIIFELINKEIMKIKSFYFSIVSKDTEEEQLKKNKAKLKRDPYYQSLLRVKKTLENCNLEIEVPDIKVEDKRNEI